MLVEPIVSLACRLFVALVFGVAALQKLRNLPGFVGVLREYRVLPHSGVPLATGLIIALEGFVAVGMWLPALRAFAALGAVTLLGTYAAAISTNLFRGRTHIDCGCSWGRGKQPLSAWLLLRNVLLAAPCGIAGLPVSAASLGAFGASVALLASASLVLSYQTFNALLANRPAIRAFGEMK